MPTPTPSGTSHRSVRKDKNAETVAVIESGNIAAIEDHIAHLARAVEKVTAQAAREPFGTVRRSQLLEGATLAGKRMRRAVTELGRLRRERRETHVAALVATLPKGVLIKDMAAFDAEIERRIEAENRRERDAHDEARRAEVHERARERARERLHAEGRVLDHFPSQVPGL